MSLSPSFIEFVVVVEPAAWPELVSVECACSASVCRFSAASSYSPRICSLEVMKTCVRFYCDLERLHIIIYTQHHTEMNLRMTNEEERHQGVFMTKAAFKTGFTLYFVKGGEAVWIPSKPLWHGSIELRGIITGLHTKHYRKATRAARSIQGGYYRWQGPGESSVTREYDKRTNANNTNAYDFTVFVVSSASRHNVIVLVRHCCSSCGDFNFQQKKYCGHHHFSDVHPSLSPFLMLQIHITPYPIMALRFIHNTVQPSIVQQCSKVCSETALECRKSWWATVDRPPPFPLHCEHNVVGKSLMYDAYCEQ